jgi:uncharacterized protein YidB (DUF937 family)
MGIISEVLSMAGTTSTQQGEHQTALVAIMNYISSPQVGGIGGLQKMFEQSGLGNVVGSWIGNGPNQAVSTNQLQGALHDGALQNAAQQAGMDPGRLAGLMSMLLPHLVDKLTPNGNVPEAGELQQMIKGQAAGA